MFGFFKFNLVVCQDTLYSLLDKRHLTTPETPMINA